MTRCGYVAIIGRPNVGKSTLLNHILGQKLSITSRKPQTTRHRLLGINTQGDTQTIYVDTPGLHRGEKQALNRIMNRAASRAIYDVDVVVFIVDGLKWLDDDEWILRKLQHATCPVILAVNKMDKIPDKKQILPQLEQLEAKMKFATIVPISAIKGDNVEVLEQEITKRLPENPHYFPDDQISDRSERFLAAEIVREKLTRNLGQELPYSLTVDIEKFKLEKGILHIYAVIFVERDGQKAIVIGDKGEGLKRIGQQARYDMEKLFDSKVFLKLWVKVKKGWSDDERALRSLGY